MKALKRLASWVISHFSRVAEPDFTASHAGSRSSSHVRHADYLDLTLPSIPRGAQQDDYLAGYPRHKHPNEPLAGFPARAGMIAGHGWKMPSPPRLPVED